MLAPPRSVCLYGQFCLLMLSILPGFKAFVRGAKASLAGTPGPVSWL